MKYTAEQIKSILENAPSGSQFYTDDYDVKYRKVIGDKYFGYLDEAKGWVETCDKQLSQERIDKGWWLPNLLKELENQMNIDKVETQTEHQEEMSEFGGEDLPKPLWAKWSVGDSVTKTKGSSWTGKVVGYYSTSLTPNGYAVESLTEKGSVQIYPEAALCDIETPQQREDRERLEAAYELYCHVIDKETTFDKFCTFGPLKAMYIKIVDKTNYRKGVK
ncbi:electron transport accessory protein-like domain protein [Vibrio phage 1.030.O._10N.222.55.F9]|nr:electron transport accessory protein-like domain protein [Vibrio phage 1.030.O._10N.222.55.F9]